MNRTELKAKLTKLAARKCWNETAPHIWDEEFCAVDMAGSNVDDAYAGGQDDGETCLARQILIDIEAIEHDEFQAMLKPIH